MRVLFENNDVVVVDKPSGVAVHPGSGIVMEETVAGELLQQYPGLPVSNGEDRPGIVHRLDKDTSGVLLVARTEEALKFYIDAWKGRRVEKVYTVLVAGLLVPETGTIEAPITRDPVHRQKMTAMKNSPKIAVTHYKVMRHFALDCPVTLVRVILETGRTHQIRVHFGAIGFPVVGDDVYGNRRVNLVFRGAFDLRRQFLHASELEFPLMGMKKRQRVRSELSDDLQAVLDRLSLTT
jgi:23S rRNA pseudouridine1911/1915/1917 synthase